MASTVRTPPQAPAPKSGKSRRLSIWLPAGVLAIFILAFAGCAALLSTFKAPTSVGPIRLHVFKPIPVSQNACPYLRRVHDTAEHAGQLWWATLTSGARGSNSTDWPLFRAEFKPRVDAFDAALRDAIPHVPQPVAAELLEVRHQVLIGKQRFGRVDTVAAYVSKAEGAVVSGYISLGNVSDLVDNACGFTVAPAVLFNAPSLTAPQ
jgi:hypothetical protein